MAIEKRSKTASAVARTKSQKRHPDLQRPAPGQSRKTSRRLDMAKDIAILAAASADLASDPVVGELLPVKTSNDGQAELDQLHRMFSECWTQLNEMRLRDELPAWVITKFPAAGRRVQMEEFHATMAELRSILAGDPSTDEEVEVNLDSPGVRIV